MPIPVSTSHNRQPESHQRQLLPVSTRVPRTKLRTLLRVSSVAAGIQFGWALQLSLLTPYVQELGIPHAWASFIWLCGPISGLVVQPLVGHFSDHCSSRFGRRRPFILAGAITIIVAVLIVGNSADIGWLLGDRGGKKTRAVVVYVFGFWILDVANNMTQGPCRAFLADLTEKDPRRTRVGNAYFSLFMAIGNVLGYATGSYSGWYKIFPFTLTGSCTINCANLKAAFLIDIIVIVICTFASLTAVDEKPLNAIHNNNSDGGVSRDSPEREAFFWEIFGTFRFLPTSVWIILLITALTWIGWFPFTLFDTDWMGREIYGGEPSDGGNYSAGVRMGSFGLMLNSIVLGITSIFMEKLCQISGSGFAWGISNILMTLCFAAMVAITYIKNSLDGVEKLPSTGIVAAALVVFSVLGIPLAVTYSVPYALVATRIEAIGLGQGLSMGVLNLAIVIPQVVVSVGSGPWDQLFGGGNSPAFIVGGLTAFIGGIIAILAIPRRRVEKPSILLHH